MIRFRLWLVKWLNTLAWRIAPEPKRSEWLALWNSKTPPDQTT